MKTFRKSNDGPLKNTNGMPIAIRKPISERGNDYYDYMRAMQLGYKPDETGHWLSRDYVTGDYLKLPGHPTIPLSVMYDVLSGYDVTRNEEGRYRSTPKKLQHSNYFQNGGVVGGGDPPGIIYVDNANDPRFKAYQDSSSLYNKYKLNESKVNAYLERKKTSDEKLKGIAEAYEIAIRNFNNVKIYALKNNITFDKKYYYDKYIKPIREKYAILQNKEREIENKYYNNIEDEYALGSNYSRPVDINIIGGNRNYYRNAIGQDIPFNKIITESEKAKKLNQEIQPINMKYLDDKRTKESFYFYPEYKKPVVEVKIKPDITNVVSNTSNTQTKEDINKLEGMKRLTREQYDAYIKNKKGKTGNWISPFGEPVNLGGAKGDVFSPKMFGAPKTFKNGGVVGGGDPPGTIYVDSANDPRFKAFQDSLTMYNLGEDAYKSILEALRTPNGMNDLYDISYPPRHSTNIYGIQPIETRVVGRRWSHNQRASGGAATIVDRYKRPIQPVIYKPKPDPKIVAKQQLLIDNGYDIGTSGADGIWGNKSKIAWEDYQSKKSKEEVNKSEGKNQSTEVLIDNRPQISQTPMENLQGQLHVRPSMGGWDINWGDGKGWERITEDTYKALQSHGINEGYYYYNPSKFNRTTAYIKNMFGAPKTFKKGGMASEKVINVEGDELEVNPNTLMIEQDFKGLPPHPANGKNPMGNVAATKSNVIIPKDMRESYIFGNTDDKRNIINVVVQRQIINNLIKNNNLKYSFGNNKMSIGGDVAMGAAQGASTGLAFGSVVPGVGNIVGTAVGAIVGAGAGLFKGMKANKVKYDLENERIMEEGKTFGSNINANIVPEENVLPEDNLMQEGGIVNASFGKGGEEPPTDNKYDYQWADDKSTKQVKLKSSKYTTTKTDAPIEIVNVNDKPIPKKFIHIQAPNQTFIGPDTRTPYQKKIQEKYTKDVLKPNLSFVEGLQNVSRYIADPLKLAGDIGVPGFPTTGEEVMKHRLIQRSPYISNKEKWNETLEQVAENATLGVLNVVPVEAIIGSGVKDGIKAIKSVPKLPKKIKQEFIYNAIDPVGYGVRKHLKKIPKVLFDNVIKDPNGRPFRISTKLGINNLEEKFNNVGKNRLDAWRIGLGLDQKYNTFTKTPEGFYKINNLNYKPAHFMAIHNDALAYSIKDNVYSGDNPLSELTKKYDKISRPKFDTKYGSFSMSDIERYLGIEKTPKPWEQKRIVEKNKSILDDSYSVYENDHSGIMGGYKINIYKDGRNLHFQTNDTWDINPFEKRGPRFISDLDENGKPIEVLIRNYKKPLEKVEVLKLLGGKPFKIQNNFIVDPKTYKTIKTFKKGGTVN